MKYSYSVPLPKFIEKRRGDKHGSRNREKFSLLRINDTIPFNRIEGQDPMIRILRFRFIVVPAYCETRLLSGGRRTVRRIYLGKGSEGSYFEYRELERRGETGAGGKESGLISWKVVRDL